ncbi:MAG: transcriptional repressor [Oscillospiraceae bacterium]|nr:transcriptional repressor [Oscillospiraceae bacterium]
MKTRNYSRKREAILEKIRSTTCHPTADWVFQALREDYPDLSLGTVYRNLVLFKDDGSILSVATVGGQERFDGETRPHAHFICRQCGDVADIETPTVRQELASSLEQVGRHQVDRVDITAYGVCAVCLEVD